jgi:hypothetical protein
MITLQLLFCFNTNTNKYEACEHIFVDKPLANTVSDTAVQTVFSDGIFTVKGDMSNIASAAIFNCIDSCTAQINANQKLLNCDERYVVVTANVHTNFVYTKNSKGVSTTYMIDMIKVTDLDKGIILYAKSV